MRISYRKALNSGKRNRVSRVVATFFDLCNQIWSGSPATESMGKGFDDAFDSTEAQSHSFESSNENISIMIINLASNL